MKLVVTAEKRGKVLDECRRVYGETYGDVIVGDFFTYPEDNQFDCVIGDIWADIIPECLEDYKKFKTKAAGLLKEDGRILAWGQDFFEYLIEKEEAS